MISMRIFVYRHPAVWISLLLLLSPVLGMPQYNKWFLELIMAVALIIVMMKKPLWILCLAVLLVPLETDPEITSGFFTINKVATFAMIGMFYQIFKDHSFRKIPFKSLLPVLLFWLWPFASTFWAENPDYTLLKMTHFFQGSSVLFLVILLLLKTKKDIWYVLVAYLGGTLFLAFRTVESFLQHPLERAVGYVGQNPAHIGFNMYLGLFTCLILASKVKPMHYKLLFYLAFFFQVFAGFTTQTRTFMLAISFALLIFIVLKKQWGAFIVLLVSIPIILHFLPSVFYERIQEGFSGADKGAGRLLIWQIGESIIKQNFIFGVGFDNFRAVFSHYFKSANVWYSREDMGAHNVYMMMLAELGFGGFLLFLYLFFYRLLLPLVKKIKTEIGLTHILLLTLMCFLIEFSFIDMLIERQTWVVVGLIFVLLNLDKQSKGMESET